MTAPSPTQTSARVRIVCLSDYPKSLLDSWLAGSTRSTEVILARRAQTLSDLLPALAKAEIVIGDAARRFPLDAQVIAGLRRCRLIIQPSVGLDGVVDLIAAQAHGIEVVNAPGYNAAAVADWTVMAMLLVLRDAIDADAELRTTGWQSRSLGRELGALTVGLIGFGAIGQAVHRRLRGFGANVVFSDPAPRTPRETGDATRLDLEEVVESSDILSLHAPLLPSTRHLMNAERLGRMRPGSILVNASRGGLIDEIALTAAIRGGRLAAAALDVFESEPLPSTSPLLALRGVYLSPHIAAGTEQARQRVRALVGRTLRQEVDSVMLKSPEDADQSNQPRQRS